MESFLSTELLSYLFSDHPVFTAASDFHSQRSVSIPKPDPPTSLGKEENIGRDNDTLFSGTI